MFSGCKSHTRIVNVIRNSDPTEEKSSTFLKEPRNSLSILKSFRPKFFKLVFCNPC